MGNAAGAKKADPQETGTHKKFYVYEKIYDFSALLLYLFST